MMCILSCFLCLPSVFMNGITKNLLDSNEALALAVSFGSISGVQSIPIKI